MGKKYGKHSNQEKKTIEESKNCREKIKSRKYTKLIRNINGK